MDADNAKKTISQFELAALGIYRRTTAAATFKHIKSMLKIIKLEDSNFSSVFLDRSTCVLSPLLDRRPAGRKL